MALGKGLLDRIKQRIKTELGLADKTTEPRNVSVDRRDIGPADALPVVMYRLREGGKRNVLLHLKYNGSWRFVEPYSFRWRSRGQQPLFYGWCDLHNEIHSFRIDKIEDVQLTDRPFSPRFEVELF